MIKFGQLVFVLLNAGCMIPLQESNLSILDIHSLILFKTVGTAEILLEILSLSNCTFSAIS